MNLKPLLEIALQVVLMLARAYTDALKADSEPAKDSAS